MTDGIKQIWSSASGHPVFRRTYHKSDGRHVLLYGFDRPNQVPVNDGLKAEPATSELRWHPLRREWNVYAAGRQNRTFKPSAADDPLAPSRHDGPVTEIPFEQFELAVFENRFPSLSRTQTSLDRKSTGFDRKPASGHCEVVVYSDATTGSLATLSLSQRELLVRAWIDRYQDLFAAGCEAVIPFENRGDEVGVTLHHPHGQIYGFDTTPPVQAAATKAFDQGFDLCGELPGWKEDFEICRSGSIAAIAPPFARYPYEVWIVPLNARRGPWELNEEEVTGFADLLGEMTRRLDGLFKRQTPYMLSLQAAPKSAGHNYQFTAQIYPILRAPGRLKYFASIEHATGVFTVDVLPERAASELRQVR